MLYLLDATSPDEPFPDPATAETEPDGLLAVGGDLSPTRLINAYSKGIFPWYNPEEPLLWWSPDPRMVLYPDNLKISRSLAKTLRRGKFEISVDQQFVTVVTECAVPRVQSPGTWISSEMIAAYRRLNDLGYAHSIECWEEGNLVGGLYGVALGKIFFGESMFSKVRDSSKIALVHLVKLLQIAGFKLIDCQVYTQHLESLGATLIPREEFLQEVYTWQHRAPDASIWSTNQPTATA